MGNSLFKYPIPFPISFLRKRAKVNPLIVNYHVVSDEILPHIEHIYNYRTINQFRDDLDILKKYYQPIDLHTFLKGIKHQVELPENALLITIDDGLKEVYSNMAPILLEKEVPATIFLTKIYVDNIELGLDHKKSLLIKEFEKRDLNEIKSIFSKYKLDFPVDQNISKSILSISYTDRNLADELGREINFDFDKYLSENKPYITSEQVKELIDKGFTFGGHSIDHARLIELNLEEQLVQANESVDFVCDNFDIDYRVFAFPYWDGGISKTFFEKIEKTIDATFGTQGLLDDAAIINHQRISFEKYHFPIPRMIKAHYGKKIIYKFLKRDKIIRE